MVRMRMFVAAGLLAVTAMSASAATVATDGTKVEGKFTIDVGASAAGASGAVIGVSDPSNAWVLQAPNGHAPVEATTPASYWIWDAAFVNSVEHPVNTFGGPVVFLYKFTLAGYKAATASLFGRIGQDDIGTVKLNGHTIYETIVGTNNWSQLRDYSTDDGSLFVDGENELSFFVANTGLYPAGLRATVTVEASPVPLPAALPLLGGALAAFGALAARRKRRAAI